MASAYTDTVQKVYIAYYGRAADPVGLAYWEGQMVANGGSLSAIMASFGASAEATTLYGNLSDTAMVNALYQQSFGRDADFAGLMHYAGGLSAGTMTAVSIAQNIFDGATGTDATILTNKLAVAKAYTTAIDSAAEVVAYSGTVSAAAARATLSTVDATTVTASFDVATAVASIVAVSSATPAVAGASYTLATTTDSITGGAGADVISGTLGTTPTLTAADSVDGGAGVDTVSISSTGATNSSSAITLTNIEQLTVIDAATTKTTFDGLSWGPLTKLTVQGSTGTETQFDNIAGIATIDLISNVGTGDIVDVNYTAATTVGTADTQVVNVNTSEGVLELAGIEAVTVNTTGSKSQMVLTNAAMTSVTVTGSADLTLTGTGSAAITTVDASAMTGKLTVDVNAANATDITVTGGAGNDTITIGTISSTDTVVGGAGSDTITTTAVVTAANAVGVSGVETLSLKLGAGATQSAAAFAVDNYTVASTTSLLTTVSNVENSDVFTMTTANTTSNHGLLLTHTEDNSANIANLVVGSTTAAANQSDITVNNAETVNITSQGAANTVTDLQATDMVTLNITAGKALTLDADSTGTYSVLTTINASASTAAVNFAGTSGGLDAAATITGGSGGDTFLGSSAADTISGGAGNDSLTGNGGNDTINGGDGTDTIVGGSGNDTLNGGAGKDTITTGTGNETVDGGAGNDTVIMTGASLTILDTIAGGEGTDTLNFTDDVVFATVATKLTNVSGFEKILMANDKDLTLTDNSVTLLGTTGVTVNRANGGNTSFVDASGVNGSTLTITADGSSQTGSGGFNYTAGLAIDAYTGTVNADTVTIGDSLKLASTDTFDGGNGADIMQININGGSTAAGIITVTAAQIGGASSFATINIDDASATHMGIILTDAVVNANASSSAMTIAGTDGSTATTALMTIDASAVTATAALTLTGGSAVDTISGGAGADEISGLGGNDVLSGGGGKDDFHVDATTAVDTISDFDFGTATTTVDQIQLLLIYTGGADGAQAADGMDTTIDSVDIITSGVIGIDAATDVAIFTGVTYADQAAVEVAIEGLNSAIVVEDFYVIYQDNFSNVHIAIAESDGSSDSNNDFVVNDVMKLTGLNITDISTLIDAGDFIVVQAGSL